MGFEKVYIFKKVKITLFKKHENFKKPLSVSKPLANISNRSLELVKKIGSSKIPP